MSSLQQGFGALLNPSEEFQKLKAHLEHGAGAVNVSGVTEAAAAHLAFCAGQQLSRGVLLVAADGITARRLYDDLRFYDEDALLFLEKELLFYDAAAGHDVTVQRLAVLEALCRNPRQTVVTSVAALLRATAPKKGYESCMEFQTGGVCGGDVNSRFLELGYTREETVEGKGQYCIRGGIIDFFPCSSSLPYRVELFGDEVDSVRLFDPVSQRTVEKTESVTVPPASEMLLAGAVRAAFEEQLRRLAEKAVDATQLRKDLERFQNSGVFPSMDRYLPLLYPELPTLLDYLPPDMLCMLYEPANISRSAERSALHIEETVAVFMEKGQIPNISGAWCYDYRRALQRLQQRPFVGLFGILTSCGDYHPAQQLTLTSKEQAAFHGKLDFFYDAVRTYHKSGYAVIVLAGTPQKAQNLTEALRRAGLPAAYAEQLLKPPAAGEILVTCGALNGGVEYPLISTAMISDREIFGSAPRRRRSSVSRNHERIKSFTDLHVGDYVVHQSHGIGVFNGIKTMTVEGASADYLQIQFSGNDLLYVPANQLDVLFKYVGKEGSGVRLNKLGGSQWAQTKRKVKKNCADMAQQLIALYASRQQIQGIAFSKSADMHRAFDATFPYDETDDQLKALSEVYADMERPVPMDRLLCGDVGYGKTEIALRAAFKAVYDGYQVAYLVPTTILASQHFATFTARMADFGVRVELLSRFRTKKQQEETVRKINRGEVDIVIGTHRIIQKDLKFKKLGLLIVDEEQRFGVAHKETLKELRKNVDVLTLSATPIPRTLHMSMVGIRDMSVLENPPADRYPVSTYVMEYNNDLVQEAVLREVARGGQVYYLHNRTETIARAAQRIQSFSPHLRVGYAHGKMSERQLEDIMQQVLDKELDVLVCTTIIETGLDIPNINTIIVEDADRMGLSQLYQLRGRVGRSNRLAYAYLLYRPDKVLTEVAAKRLRAIRDFTEFGSGFKIALRDLEIRGAGNVIGAQQHGMMEAVGYDLYCQLLEEAVVELKGGAAPERPQASVSLYVNAFIPKDYIRGENYRIEMYKKISLIQSQQDAYDVYEELEDRYGTVPPEVDNLIEIACIRSLAADCGIEDVRQQGNNAVLVFYQHAPLDLQALSALIAQQKELVLFSPMGKPYLTVRAPAGKLLANIKIVLQAFKALKDGAK